MAFYKTCPRCGSNLDPGEQCDCEREEKKKRELYAQSMRVSPKTGQLSFMFDRKDVDYVAKGTY